MKTLPKSFGIKRDASNPLWDKYVKWLINKGADIEGKGDWYYGISKKGVIGYNSHDYTRFETILTLEEWDSIVNGWQPKKGEMVEVRYYECDDWMLREFLCMDGDRFVCRHESVNNVFYAWLECRPIDKNTELKESIARMEKELAEMKSKLEEI